MATLRARQPRVASLAPRHGAAGPAVAGHAAAIAATNEAALVTATALAAVEKAHVWQQPGA